VKAVSLLLLNTLMMYKFYFMNIEFGI